MRWAKSIVSRSKRSPTCLVRPVLGADQFVTSWSEILFYRESGLAYGSNPRDVRMTSVSHMTSADRRHWPGYVSPPGNDPMSRDPCRYITLAMFTMTPVLVSRDDTGVL